MRPTLLVLACIGTAANLLLFVFLISTTHFHSVRPEGATGLDSYDAISLQVTILGIVIAAVGLGLAVAAFFGYQALQAIVLRRADELVNKRLNRLDSDQSPEEQVKPFTATPPQEGVSEEKGTI